MRKLKTFLYTTLFLGTIGMGAYLWLNQGTKDFDSNMPNGWMRVTKTTHRSLFDPFNNAPKFEVKYIPRDNSGTYIGEDADADRVLEMPLLKSANGFVTSIGGVKLVSQAVPYAKSDIDTVQAHYTEMRQTIDKLTN